MAKQYLPLGQGRIVWLGINFKRGEFSRSRAVIAIAEDGIVHDMYRGLRRKIVGHDVDYVATDGVEEGDWVRNRRQITIVEDGEVKTAGKLAGIKFEDGMLRENVVVVYEPLAHFSFSQLPHFSRMVIEGLNGRKVLHLTEENGPCRTITNPLARHFGRSRDWSE